MGLYDIDKAVFTVFILLSRGRLDMRYIPELQEMEKEIKTLSVTFTTFINMIHLQTVLYEKRIIVLENANRRKKIVNILTLISDYSYLVFLTLLTVLFFKFILHF